jgi:hypothetical protein
MSKPSGFRQERRYRYSADKQRTLLRRRWQGQLGNIYRANDKTLCRCGLPMSNIVGMNFITE